MSQAPSDSGSIKLSVDPEMLCVGKARRFVRSALAGWVAEELSSDLQLAVSELVTNAIEHGHADRVKVDIAVEPPVVELSVLGGGGALRPPEVAAMPKVQTWALSPPVTTTGGRGLVIVRALCDDIEVGERCGQDLVTLRCRIR